MQKSFKRRLKLFPVNKQSSRTVEPGMQTFDDAASWSIREDCFPAPSASQFLVFHGLDGIGSDEYGVHSDGLERPQRLRHNHNLHPSTDVEGASWWVRVVQS
jgi:hypothetical protein